MDIKNNVDYKTYSFEEDNILGENKYNYAKNGILTKCLPKILFKGNSIFVTFLQLIDLRFIMLCKYIDKLKRFKYISWYD